MSTELKPKFPETKQPSDGEGFSNTVVIPDLSVIHKVEGTKLEGGNARPGMFKLYRKEGMEFLPTEFKAIPLFWTAYTIAWSADGKFAPSLPPFQISIHDENKSVRYNSSSKTYEQGPLVFGDAANDVPQDETFAKHGKSGLLLYLLLEDEKVGRLFLQFKDMEAFKDLAGNLQPFQPITVKTKKSKTSKGVTVYRLEFAESSGFPKVDVETFVSKVKEEVETMVDLQNGVEKEAE